VCVLISFSQEVGGARVVEVYSGASVGGSCVREIY
jgi:hypothetical protein